MLNRPMTNRVDLSTPPPRRDIFRREEMWSQDKWTPNTTVTDGAANHHSRSISTGGYVKSGLHVDVGLWPRNGGIPRNPMNELSKLSNHDNDTKLRSISPQVSVSEVTVRNSFSDISGGQRDAPREYMKRSLEKKADRLTGRSNVPFE